MNNLILNWQSRKYRYWITSIKFKVGTEVIMQLLAESGLGKEAYSAYVASNPMLFINPTQEKHTNELKVRLHSTACSSCRVHSVNNSMQTVQQC